MSKSFKPEMTKQFFSEVSPSIAFHSTYSVLDHGCGVTGVLSCWLLNQLRHANNAAVYFSDIMHEAIRATHAVLEEEKQRLGSSVNLHPVLVDDSQEMTKILPPKSIDLLVSNLAQFPLPYPHSDGYFVGKDGREMIYSTINELIPHCLKGRGVAFLSWTELSNLSQSLGLAKALGFDAEVISFGEFPLYAKTWLPKYMEHLDQLDCTRDPSLNQFRTELTASRIAFSGDQQPIMLGGWLKLSAAQKVDKR